MDQLQQALTNASITDFVIIENQDRIGGRVKAVDFGKKDGQSKYKVELGANWVGFAHQARRDVVLTPARSGTRY